MTNARAKPSTVDFYIATAPEATRPIPRQLRQIITSIVPESEETISFGMPFTNTSDVRPTSSPIRIRSASTRLEALRTICRHSR